MDNLTPQQYASLPEGGIDLPTMKWLAEQMPGGFFIYQEAEPMRLLYANSAVLHIFGCENEEEFQALTGGTFTGMVYPEDLPAVMESISDQITEGDGIALDHVEYRILRRDNSIRWVDDYGRKACFPDAGPAFYVFISDVTEHRLVREEQARMELALEKEKRANEVKSDFLFHISHDIRTPMNAIVGFAELARRHIGDTAQLHEDLDRVHDSSQQMLELIDDLLEMSRLESRRVSLSPESASLREQVERVLLLFRFQAEEKGITVHKRLELPPEHVMLDISRFRRLIGNLISNAIKFTPPGGMVTVSARCDRTSESGFGRYSFDISDTGIGMSEEFQARMFQAFEREQSSTVAGVTGTGLGLSITKRLTDIMGGSISVQSEKGKGTTVTVELPLQKAERAANPVNSPAAEMVRAMAAESREKGMRRVLLVEDIELNRMLAETLLEEAGFLVESEPDGCDAVEAMRRNPAGYYDLILMDIQMPVMNGYEATRAIRALDKPDAATIPIIALSANARDEDKRRSLESGMNYHIAKPFDVVGLISAVNDYIAARELVAGEAK